MHNLPQMCNYTIIVVLKVVVVAQLSAGISLEPYQLARKHTKTNDRSY